ncbi:MAG: sialate O-acetylesterase [Lachnospiraceae bacterium]|nr:sialate O-acetylesterase [Lachnospiraceae bacterium]
MSTIKFARIFADGAVLQRRKPIHIWGFSDEENVTVTLGERSAECKAADGRFDAVFPACEKGGPFTLTADDGKGNKAVSSDIMIGDVVLISGQSNMEFPMERVKETYPHEWDEPKDKLIRTFKVTENGVFGKDIPDVETGQWNILSGQTIDDFSAVGYFTAKHMRIADDAAVGIVDVTLGGAPIEAFMSEEMLLGYEPALAEAEKFADDEYRLGILASNEKDALDWHADLDRNDEGLRNGWQDGAEILRNGRDIMLPDFFSDTELDGYTGSVWIAKNFTVQKEMAGKPATVWFGTLVDFDFCYINGTMVGNTEYTYPPRRYKVPEGLITEGENTIVLRIGIEKGFGRVTPGKIYGIVFGDCVRTSDGFYEGAEGADHIEYLSGIWKYLKGRECSPSPEMVFVNWKPTALYHGMLAPLAGFSVRAFAFYQGESNCPRNHEYADLTKRFINGLRKLWDDDIPYICVQLPEFNARMEEVSFDGGKAWRGLMAAQESCKGFPGFYLVRSYGTGELNDLHPQRKEPIGESIAKIIASIG